MGKRKRAVEQPKNEDEYDLAGKHLKQLHVKTNEKRLFVILEGAQLETVKVKKFFSFPGIPLIYSFWGGKHVRAAELWWPSKHPEET